MDELTLHTENNHWVYDSDGDLPNELLGVDSKVSNTCVGINGPLLENLYVMFSFSWLFFVGTENVSYFFINHFYGLYNNC